MDRLRGPARHLPIPALLAMFEHDRTMSFVAVLILIAFVNIVASQARTSRTAIRDARRLRAAFLAELNELWELHKTNLDRLARGSSYVLSTKSCTAIYRGNVGRMNLIADADIPVVVAAYTATEKAETLVAAMTRLYNGAAYRLIAGETSDDLLTSEIGQAKDRVHAAIGMLARHKSQQAADAPDAAP